MIVGIGNDMVKICRFENMKESFIKKMFTEREVSAANGRPSFFAANFSVKEAVSKAFGTGIRGFGLKDIEVLRDELGKPYVELYGGAEKIAKEKNIENIFVSITDTKELVVTMVVAEGK